MIIPPAILVAAAVVVGLIGLAGHAGPTVQAAAIRFEDQAWYNATVLHAGRIAHPVAPVTAGATGVTAVDVLAALGSVAGALILAGLALYRRRLPFLSGYVPSAWFAAAVRRFHSGVVNDYVTWVVIGLACLGGVFILIFGLSVFAWCEFSGAVTLDPAPPGYAPGTSSHPNEGRSSWDVQAVLSLRTAANSRPRTARPGNSSR